MRLPSFLNKSFDAHVFSQEIDEGFGVEPERSLSNLKESAIKELSRLESRDILSSSTDSKNSGSRLFTQSWYTISPRSFLFQRLQFVQEMHDVRGIIKWMHHAFCPPGLTTPAKRVLRHSKERIEKLNRFQVVTG